MAQYEDTEAFHEDGSVDSNIIVRDTDGTIWSGWCSDSGDWYVARARIDDEQRGPEDDPWRPVGPVNLDDLPFPIEVFNIFEAFAKPDDNRTAVVAERDAEPDDDHTSDGRCKYPKTCEVEGRHSVTKHEHDVAAKAQDDHEYQYGIDHRRSDIQTESENGEPWTDEFDVAVEFDEFNYGNARILRRAVGPWEEAQRDDDGEIVGWTSPLVDWDDIPEED